ncbi:adenylate/guanylate cyclase domain-containing protein [Baaleninema sp.]|uniref:adenylate/guanylate cyclase domain-containing protein n=1 Tax=Baaleninema sp. TaxID=3101197 RepID=UPI003D019A65
MSRFSELLTASPTPPTHPAYRPWRDRFVRKRLTLGLGLVSCVYLTFSALELWHWLFEKAKFNADWSIIQLVTLILTGICFVLLRSKWGRTRPGWVFVLFSVALTLTPIVQRILVGHLEPALMVWPLVFLGQATLIPVSWRLHLLAQLIPLGVYLGGLSLPGITSDIPIANLTLGGLILYLGWTCTICNLSVFFYEKMQRAEFTARRQLEEAYDRLSDEQKRSEELLLNILPSTIAQRLKAQTQHCAIADSFSDAGVLFADIVGFTKLSGQISPPELVELLNEIFSEFDRLADLHGLEKIKTIGDAYMAVSGLPEPRDDFDEAIADMALEMKRALVKFNQRHSHQFQMRIGIAVGPVVAGVIGLKKFIYDLWGDTVNLASRMESHGLPDGIQVTESTYERLKDRYEFQSRGIIDIKGKGPMTTYLLIGQRPSLNSSTTLVAGVAPTQTPKKNAQD